MLLFVPQAHLFPLRFHHVLHFQTTPFLHGMLAICKRGGGGNKKHKELTIGMRKCLIHHHAAGLDACLS